MFLHQPIQRAFWQIRALRGCRDVATERLPFELCSARCPQLKERCPVDSLVPSRLGDDLVRQVVRRGFPKGFASLLRCSYGSGLFSDSQYSPAAETAFAKLSKATGLTM